MGVWGQMSDGTAIHIDFVVRKSCWNSEASAYGNVKGVDRVLSDGRRWKGAILKPGKFSNGYLFVNLRGNGVQRNELVHRLVAVAFLPNSQGLEAVNHIDGNKANNNVSNLEWVTYSENLKHAARIGLRKTKLNRSKLEYIKDQLAKGRSQQSIADEIGVSQVLISQALLGKLAYLMY